MTAQHFDNVALGLALAAVALRYWDRPWAANLCSSVCLAAATIGQWSAHRDQCRREAAARSRGR